MTRALLDTDIFSEVLTGIDQRVASRARAYHTQYGHYTISAVTVVEVVKGFHKVGSERRLRQFLAKLQAIEVLAFDAEAAAVAGRIFADLERSGQPIGRADPQIGATALQHGLPLATGNTDHYERIRGLGYGLLLAQLSGFGRRSVAHCGLPTPRRGRRDDEAGAWNGACRPTACRSACCSSDRPSE